MRILQSLLPLLIVAVALPGMVRADEAMSAEEVKLVLTGNTALGRSRGAPYWWYRRADGTQALETDGGFSDEGEWNVKDDGTVCYVWEKIRDGDEHCTKIFRLDENRFYGLRADGTKFNFKMLNGNPENL